MSLEDGMIQERLGRGEEGREEGLGGGEGKAPPTAGLVGGEGRGGHGFPHSEGGRCSPRHSTEPGFPTRRGQGRTSPGQEEIQPPPQPE